MKANYKRQFLITTEQKTTSQKENTAQQQMLHPRARGLITILALK